MQFPNKTFTCDELMNRLRGIDAELFSRAVDTLVSRLRHKLKDTSKTPRFIKTVWGVVILLSASNYDGTTAVRQKSLFVRLLLIFGFTVVSFS